MIQLNSNQLRKITLLLGGYEHLKFLVERQGANSAITLDPETILAIEHNGEISTRDFLEIEVDGVPLATRDGRLKVNALTLMKLYDRANGRSTNISEITDRPQSAPAGRAA